MKKTYSSIDEAIKDGFKLHCFRSGGGLRVISLKKGSKSFYAESHNLQEALRILKTELSVGGRKYKDVYGLIEPHYLTGSYPNNNDKADMYVVNGNTIDAEKEKGTSNIKVTLHHPLYPKNRPMNMILDDITYWKYDNLTAIFKVTPIYLWNGAKGYVFSSTEKDTHQTEEINTFAPTFEYALMCGLLQVFDTDYPWSKVSNEEGERAFAIEELNKMKDISFNINNI